MANIIESAKDCAASEIQRAEFAGHQILVLLYSPFEPFLPVQPNEQTPIRAWIYEKGGFAETTGSVNVETPFVAICMPSPEEFIVQVIRELDSVCFATYHWTFDKGAVLSERNAIRSRRFGSET